MQQLSIAPLAVLSSLWHHRDLIVALTRREVIGRYRGSILGILWSFFNPLFMLIVYTFVFGVIFKARWNTGNESKTEFALVLFAGLIVFNLFAECINKAPTLIINNVNYVKKVVFPLEILPVVSLGTSLFHLGVSLCVWTIGYIILFGTPHLTALYIPIIVLPLLIMVLGLTWILASLGVYLRDVGQFVGTLTLVLQFLSPIFYPISILPPTFQRILLLNPLTPIIEQTRQALYFGNSPDLTLLSIYLGISFLVAYVGFVWFQKTRKGFADVL